MVSIAAGSVDSPRNTQKIFLGSLCLEAGHVPDPEQRTVLQARFKAAATIQVVSSLPQSCRGGAAQGVSLEGSVWRAPWLEGALSGGSVSGGLPVCTAPCREEDLSATALRPSLPARSDWPIRDGLSRTSMSLLAGMAPVQHQSIYAPT